MVGMVAASAFPGWLEALLAVYLVVGSVLGIGFVVGVIVLVVKIRRTVAQIGRQVSEVTSQVKTTADQVSGTVNTVAERARRIGETVENTVTDVARKVEVTVDVLRDAVAGPVINASALVTGVRKAVETLVARRRARREAEGEQPE